MSKTILYVLLIILGMADLGLGQNTAIQKCPPTKKLVKYKLLGEPKLPTERGKIILKVLISPKNFTEAYLTKFATQISSTYCHADYIGVNLFDDREMAKGAHYEYVVTGGRVDRRRGTYVLDRTTGEEDIEYSTKPGNPINEVRIELSKTKTKVP